MENRFPTFNSKAEYDAAKDSLLVPYVATYPSETDGKTVVVYANVDGTNENEVVATAQLTNLINSISDELNQMSAAINDNDNKIASLREDTNTKLTELEEKTEEIEFFAKGTEGITYNKSNLSEGFYYTDGVKMSNSISVDLRFLCLKIKVSKYDKFVINNKAFNSQYARCYAITDNELNIVDLCDNNVNVRNKLLVVNQDGYLYANVANDETSKNFFGISTIINSHVLQEQITESKKELDKKANIERIDFGKESLLDGFYNLSSSSTAPDKITQNASYKCVRIPLQIGRRYILNCHKTGSSGARPFAITDTKLAFLYKASESEDAINKVIIPKTNGYLYVNCTNTSNYLDTFSVVTEYKLSDLNDILTNLLKDADTIYFASVMAKEILRNGYYDLTLQKIGNIKSHTDLVCAKIPVIKGEKYYLTNGVVYSSAARCWAITDKDCNVLSVAGNGDSANKLLFEIEQDGFIFVDVMKSLEDGFKIEQSNYCAQTINDKLFEIDNIKKSFDPEDIPSEKTIVTNGGNVAIFGTFGVIGDSLSSGEMAYHNSTDESTTFYRDMYEYSWGKFMSKACGNKEINFSIGGASTSSFLEDVGGNYTKFMNKENFCQAYFIALTHNDYNYCKRNWQTLGYSSLNACIDAYIGSISDIDVNNYNNNADTFYGRYAKIIQKIHENVPHAKVFPITAMSTTVFGKFNAAIRAMATLFNNIYIVDMNKYFPTMPNWHYTEGHGNAMGYMAYSQRIATITDWIIRNHREAFKYTSLINTDLNEYIPSSADISVPSNL